MVFDPFRNPDRNRFIPGNLPPGAVPPGILKKKHTSTKYFFLIICTLGARFDPYGPPNPDDLRPGYSRVGYIEFKISFNLIYKLIITFYRPNPSHLQPPDFDDQFM